MAKRNIIKIDIDKCVGCGNCVPDCPEGAIQMIDGKARIISDLFCDGLGACIGSCPVDAIIVEKREAQAYDERKVMENIVPQGDNVIKAHLKHLQDHSQTDFLKEAIAVLNEKGIIVPEEFTKKELVGGHSSALSHWPIQLHLVSPMAPCFLGKDIVISADCVAFSLGNFHSKYLKGKSLAIACPKLDSNKEIYIEKIISMINEAQVNTITVMIMEVQCCNGLLMLVKEAVQKAGRRVPLKQLTVGLKGEILKDEWVDY